MAYGLEQHGCSNVMYVIEPRTTDEPTKRWALPDRVFFACGACHILAYAFLKDRGTANSKAVWIKPKNQHRGNHIVAVTDDVAFDYHGYSSWQKLRSHMYAKANRWWPGWSADYIDLPQPVLISEPESKTYDGLWLREPMQFLHDAMPRARDFLRRFPVRPI